jgi:acetyltransferase-like isoleucine patch superfamily enzyme
VIAESATIGEGTVIGEHAVICENVRVGRNCRIGHHVVIHPDVVIGDAVRVDDGAVLGKLPLKATLSATTQDKDLPKAKIGNQVLIGSGAVIYRGCTLSDGVLVADLASIREDVRIGPLTIIGRGVTVENHVSIGKRCKIETEAYITALSDIGDYCFISPEVTFSNDNFMGRTEERFKHFRGVTLKRGARVGANCTVLPGVTIGEDGVAAAGSVVTSDIPPRVIHLGVPARYFRDVPEDQLIEAQTHYEE